MTLSDAANHIHRPGRPALRYHGGKYKLAPWIVSHLPRHQVYTEPYMGAASVFFCKPRSYAEVLNDLDAEIVVFFQVLRDPQAASQLERALRLTPFARQEFELAYQPADDPIETARRLIVRSFMGFGSSAFNAQQATGFRSNSNRSGTTPAHDWMNYPNVIRSLTERLQGVVIENRPAIEIIQQHDSPNTLHYIDPPYVFSTRKHRQIGNYKFEMTDDQHKELARVLHTVRGLVVLSGYPSALYDELYADWRRIERSTHADGARDRTECLWLSPNIQQMTLF